MKKLTLVVVSLMLIVVPSLALAAVSGSDHDLTGTGAKLCFACHTPHNAAGASLWSSAPSGTFTGVQDLCYTCHADKQGPFVYEHAPVTENCVYCHNPHGAVADNLLRQPVTFLCMRCHTGHQHRSHEEQLSEVVWAWDQIKESRNFQT